MKKLYLYWNTIRFLKLKQIFYQIYYKFKAPLLPFILYKKYFKNPLYPIVLNTTVLINSNGKYIRNNTFHFLNLTHSFKNDVDWNFEKYGKLWNYNLQYFDYLHDERIEEIEKQRLIESFSAQLIKKKIPPEAYPVSLRLINWIIYYSKSGYTSDNFEKTLKYQIHFLEKNLEYQILANHLLENYFALFVCAYALKNEKLTQKSFLRIVKELKEQVLNDGCHYEGSPMYHCIILSKLLLIIDIIQQNTWININEEILREKAEKMLAWLNSFCFKKGSYAHFNDSADGIAPEPKILFERGKKLGLKIENIPLKESGYRKYVSRIYEAIVDIGNILPSYQPGHIHSDIFSFTLNYKGNPVFVDTGISTYEYSPRRYYERSTIAHNTVVVNDLNQSQVWGSFRVARRAKVNISNENEYSIKAFHDGYFKEFGVIHTRQFFIRSASFDITDEIVKKENINSVVVALFHLDTSVSVTELNGFNVQLSNGLKLCFQNAETVSINDFQQACGFNKLISSKKIVVSFSNQLHTQISIA